MTVEALRHTLRRAPHAPLALVVLVGSVVRLLLHGGVTYSPADESVYARYACALEEQGLGAYPDVVHTFLATPSDHLYPSPARWAFLLPDALAAEAVGCGPASVAWVSTLASVAMLVVVAVLAARTFPAPVALVATVLVASSPLQLLVGRRALGDELLGLVVVISWWAVRHYAARGSRSSWLAACLVLVLGFGVKEIFFLALPAVAVPLLVQRRRHRPGLSRLLWDLGLLVLPPLLNAMVVAALARSWTADLELLRAVASTTDAAYPATYMSGPWHRLVVDLLLVAPLATLLAVGAVGLLLDRGSPAARMVALSVPAALAPYAVVGAQDVRLVVAAETFVALLAAWGLATALRGRPFVLAISTSLVVLSNAWMVWTLSVRGEVYDPVTAELARVLGMIP